jgi:hypothetical protein
VTTWPRLAARRVRTWIVTEWSIKLTALILATVLWAAVAAEEPTTQLVPVVLDVAAPAGRAITGPLPQILALYAGTRRELLKLAGSPPVIHVSLPDSVSGSSYTMNLSPTDLAGAANANVSVQDVQPRVITIPLDDVVQRTVRVVHRITVVPDSGFEQFGGIAVTPSSVAVRGPEDVVAGVTELYTVPLELTGVTEPVSRRVALDTTGIAGAHLATPDVQVTVDVGPVSERVLMGIPVTLPRDRAGNWESDPPAVIVTVRGRSGRLARLTRDSVEVVALIQDGDAEQVAQLDVLAPPGMSATVTPDTAFVRRRPRG